MKKKVLLDAVLALALTFSAALAGAQSGAAQNIPFVDAHVHLNDVAMQLELMERHGASHAVVFWGGLSDNETVQRAAAASQGRLIPFASISPERTAYRPAWANDDKALLDALDRVLATGRFLGIGEINVTHFPSAGFPETDFSPVGAMNRGVLLLARKYRVPVMLHVEWTRMSELSALLAEFRDVPVIWAHGGYTPLYIARRMLDAHPNLYYELSARTWPRHPRSPDYTILRDGVNVWPEWLALIEKESHRFIVGTDASHRSAASETMKFESVQNFLRQLSPGARLKVGRENILGLLGLK
ncbi:MAG: TatD family hydrolase [Pseudomonadota bacterium]